MKLFMNIYGQFFVRFIFPFYLFRCNRPLSKKLLSNWDFNVREIFASAIVACCIRVCHGSKRNERSFFRHIFCLVKKKNKRKQYAAVHFFLVNNFIFFFLYSTMRAQFFRRIFFFLPSISILFLSPNYFH